MLTVRLSELVMVAGLALFALLVALDNVADYGSNEAFVRHVLAMDTTFPQNALRWRVMQRCSHDQAPMPSPLSS